MPMLSSATGAGLPPQSEMNNLASSSAAENMNDDRQVSAADTKSMTFYSFYLNWNFYSFYLNWNPHSSHLNETKLRRTCGRFKFKKELG